MCSMIPRAARGSVRLCMLPHQLSKAQDRGFCLRVFSFLGGIMFLWYRCIDESNPRRLEKKIVKC
jgi:hypothetical protein